MSGLQAATSRHPPNHQPKQSPEPLLRLVDGWWVGPGGLSWVSREISKEKRQFPGLRPRGPGAYFRSFSLFLFFPISFSKQKIRKGERTGLRLVVGRRSAGQRPPTKPPDTFTTHGQRPAINSSKETSLGSAEERKCVRQAVSRS